MKIPLASKQFIQKRNRIVSRIAKLYQRTVLRTKIFALQILASIMNLMDAGFVAPIFSGSLESSGDGKAVTLGCVGSVDMACPEDYPRDLSCFARAIESVDGAFAMAVNHSVPDHAVADGLLRDRRIIPLLPEKPVCSRLFDSPAGKIAVITYDRTRPGPSGNREKLILMRHILSVKKAHADFILVYINNPKGSLPDSSGGSRLNKILAYMGADYVIGVTPDRLDSGTTYRRADGSTARTILSLGSFLTGSADATAKRVFLRLKLVNCDGKVLLAEETYYPYHYDAAKGPVSLLDNCSGDLDADLVIKYRSELEDEMSRIRPLDRLLTVGQIMDLTGSVLPEHLQYMKDFSVGKICARSYEVKPGDVFFFREPFADPNDLVPVSEKHRKNIARTAARRGAMLVITYCDLPFNCNQVLCPNAMEGHIAVCAHLRRQFAMKTIGITGSVGKTSTKDMLTEVLRMQYHTVKSERNANVQVKIAENLQKLNSSCEIFIQEIGGGRPGGASRHARMVLPQVCVITNIGDAHIGNFGSKEKLMANKLGIIEGMDPEGVLYLNGDDPLLAAARPACKVVYYAVHNKNADYYVENTQQLGARTTFDIVHNGVRTPVVLNVLGEYNVLNAVCSFAIGRQFGIPEETIVEGLSHFQTTGIRQNLMEVCGRKLFMDCYNASSDSVHSALDALIHIPIEEGKKRIAVIGDITGAGSLAAQIHTEVGKTLSRYDLDMVVFFGRDVQHAYEVLRQTHNNVHHFTRREDLNFMLRQHVNVGDVVMFKGSSKMLLEYSVDMVFGTRLTDQRLVDEREYKYTRRGSIVYDLFADHATAAVYSPLRTGERRVQVASHVGSIEVVNMGRALQAQNIVEVDMPDTIRHISAEAFMDCTQLTLVHMPKGLKYIGNGAFKRCKNLREIKLPDHVLHIGKEAFSGCHNLQHVTIGAEVVQIGADAFAGCENCRFTCPKGSYAEQYLTKAGLKFKTY